MPASEIHVDIPVAMDRLHGHDDLAVDAQFDIPIHSKHRGMAISGIVAFAIGFLLLVVMAGFFLAGYPDDWYPVRDAQGTITNAQDVADLQELVGTMALIAVPFLFLGLSLYTYGRSYRGDEDVEALARDRRSA